MHDSAAGGDPDGASDGSDQDVQVGQRSAGHLLPEEIGLPPAPDDGNAGESGFQL